MKSREEIDAAVSTFITGNHAAILDLFMGMFEVVELKEIVNDMVSNTIKNMSAESREVIESMVILGKRAVFYHLQKEDGSTAI